MKSVYATMMRNWLAPIVLALGPVHAMAAGALAIDSNQGGQYGWAVNHATSAQAEQRALAECGSGCQIVFRFNRTCAAYAADQSSGSTAYGWAYAPSASSAQNEAVSQCRSRRGSACMVRAWGCDNR